VTPPSEPVVVTSPTAPLLAVVQDPRPETLVASRFTTYCVLKGDGVCDPWSPHPALPTSAVPNPVAIPANVLSFMAAILPGFALGHPATRNTPEMRSLYVVIFTELSGELPTIAAQVVGRKGAPGPWPQADGNYL
jgi:hypothetical protein